MSRGFDPVQLEAAAAAQRQALHPARSVWVSASAGSGKTEMLTRRLLALLLADPRLMPRQILALTFTRAGAAEMAERLPRHLARLAALDDAALLATIRSELGTGIGPGDDAAAERALAARIRTLAHEVVQAPPLISTIHGLAQQLLTRFAHEAGLPDDFGVLEDAEQARLLRDIQHHLLQHAQGPLADSLATLLDELGEHGWRDLTTLMIYAWRTFEDLLDDGGAAGVMARLDAALNLTGGEGWALGELAILDTERAALRTVADILPAHDAARIAALRDPLAAWRLFLLTKDDTPRARLFIKKDLALIGEETEAVFRAAQLRLAEQLRLRRVLRGRRLTEDLLLWCASIRSLYARKKRERGALDYADLLDALEALLDRSGDALADRVWYALDRRFAHLVLDEGQDNNPQQNRIVLRLARSILSGDVGEDSLRTVMAVGDLKQSIFRFQGARPELFVDLRDTLQAWSGDRFAAVDIVHSFRSGPHILAAVDAVFADPGLARAVTGLPDWLPHRAVASARSSRVELWPLAAPPPPADLQPWALPQARFDAHTHGADILCFTQVGHWLQDQIARGVVMPSTGLPLRFDDVLIVVQRNKMAALAAGVLERMGIPVAAAGVLPQPVRDMVCLLRAVFDPRDKIALCAILKAFKHWDDARILTLAGRNWVLPEPEAAWLAGFDAADIPALIQRGICHLGAPPALFDTLLEWAVRADSLAALIARLQQEDLPAAAHGKGVRILTVHGSKGLEAPLVILPDTTARMGDVAREKILWGDGTLLYRQGKGLSAFEDRLTEDEAARLRADSLRALYVAMTRARDWLVVTGFARGRGSREQALPADLAAAGDCWYALLAEAARAWRDGVLGDSFETSGPDLPPRQPPSAGQTTPPPWLAAAVKLPLVAPEDEC